MKAGHPPHKKIHINLSHMVCHSPEFNPLSGGFFPALLCLKEKVTAPALLSGVSIYTGRVPCLPVDLVSQDCVPVKSREEVQAGAPRCFLLKGMIK